MAVTTYNAVREFMSRRYPKKGKKGIGKRNRSHNPPIKRMNFHLCLNLVYMTCLSNLSHYFWIDSDALVKERSEMLGLKAISSVGVLSLVTSRLKNKSISQSTETRSFFSTVGRLTR